MSNREIKEKIARLKKEKNAVILAHYYVDGEVQAIADFVGDSYYLAERLQQYRKMQFYSVEFHSWEKVQRF